MVLGWRRRAPVVVVVVIMKKGSRQQPPKYRVGGGRWRWRRLGYWGLRLERDVPPLAATAGDQLRLLFGVVMWGMVVMSVIMVGRRLSVPGLCMMDVVEPSGCLGRWRRPRRWRRQQV